MEKTKLKLFKLLRSGTNEKEQNDGSVKDQICSKESIALSKRSADIPRQDIQSTSNTSSSCDLR